jgi:hypothetical protein
MCTKCECRNVRLIAAFEATADEKFSAKFSIWKSFARIPYATLTFQKMGAPNLRTSPTFFRNAVG